VAQQDNYRKSGFVFAYKNIRYGGWAPSFHAAPNTVSLREVPFEVIASDDAAVFPAARPVFLRNWVAAPDHIGRALIRARYRLPAVYPFPFEVTEGGLIAYGVRLSDINPQSSKLRRSHPQGREASRSSGAVADQVRVGDKSQDRQGHRPHHAAVRTRPRRRSDPMNSAISASGMKQTPVTCGGHRPPPGVAAGVTPKPARPRARKRCRGIFAVF
jgi:hypothetical protein